jgi:hypothetical protein
VLLLGERVYQNFEFGILPYGTVAILKKIKAFFAPGCCDAIPLMMVCQLP